MKVIGPRGDSFGSIREFLQNASRHELYSHGKTIGVPLPPSVGSDTLRVLILCFYFEDFLGNFLDEGPEDEEPGSEDEESEDEELEEDRPRATTRAIEIAEEEGIDLSEVEGSGEEGRILAEDVRAHEQED